MHFHLYVTDRRSPLSMAALDNLRSFCSDALGTAYVIDVIDVNDDPSLAEKDKILATPTVVRKAPKPNYRIVGDLSDRASVMHALMAAIPVRTSGKDRRSISDRETDREVEALLRAISVHGVDGLLVVDGAGEVLFANRACADLLGYAPDTLVGCKIGTPALTDGAEIQLRSGHLSEVRVADTEWHGRPAHLMTFRDVTERHRAQRELERVTRELRVAKEQLESIAFLDPLTSLLNRRGLEQALEHELAQMARGGSGSLAVLIDCDDFKELNETLGHAGGDAVLAALAARLRSHVRPTDYLARIGGDEFLLILPETRLLEGIQLAERIRGEIAAEPVSFDSKVVHITLSMGIATIPRDSASISEILRLTRSALKQSKTLGKNRLSADSPVVMQDARTGKFARWYDLLRVVQLPIIDLSSSRPVGYELLTRGPEGAMEMPRDFLRVAADDGILTLVDLRCMEACLAAARLLEGQEEDTRFHFNMLPSTILDNAPADLLPLLPETDCWRYCIEISEQQLIGDPMRVRKQMKTLRERGIRVAVDDVGFGRSCLEGLIVIEPDVVKIDRPFVNGVGQARGKRNMLERLVGVAHSLGAEMIAEGISSEADLKVLQDLGVPYGQGFLWGRPEASPDPG